MDNIINNIVKFLFVIFLGVFLLLGMFLFAPKNTAYATSINVSATATCSTFDFSNNDYVTTSYDLTSPVYAKDIKITFSVIGDYDYYYFGTQAGYEEEILDLTYKPQTDSIEYLVSKSGDFKVILHLTNESKEDIFTFDSAVVKSDIDAPNTFATISAMDNWIGINSINKEYQVIGDFHNFGDELSGKGDAYYRYVNSEEVEIIPRTKVVDDYMEFAIIENGVLWVSYYDKAGNKVDKGYTYDKFDFVKPLVPTITLTPFNDNLSGYHKSYTVNIDYKDADVKKYLYNNEEKDYIGEFVIAGEREHTIKAIAYDKAGNSDFSEEKIDTNNFDCYAPNIVNVDVSYNLKNNDFAKVKIKVTDNKSLVKSVMIERNGSEILLNKTSEDNVYSVELQLFNTSGFTIKVEDYAGNTDVRREAVLHFSDIKFSDKVREYMAKLPTINENDYNETIIDKINHEYDTLSLMLGKTTPKEEFYDIFDEIDLLINTEIYYKYIIEEVPLYWSTNIKFDVDRQLLSGSKKGDTITIKLKANKSTTQNYLGLSGFNKGFCDYIRLEFYHNGVFVDRINNGVSVEMNMPSGYYDRNFKVLSVENNSLVDIATPYYSENYLKTNFRITGSGDYGIVISGVVEKTPTIIADEVDTIKVFGRNIKLSSFIILLSTVGGVTIVAVVIMLIMARRAKKRG